MTPMLIFVAIFYHEDSIPLYGAVGVRHVLRRCVGSCVNGPNQTKDDRRRPMRLLMSLLAILTVLLQYAPVGCGYCNTWSTNSNNKVLVPQHYPKIYSCGTMECEAPLGRRATYEKEKPFKKSHIPSNQNVTLMTPTQNKAQYQAHSGLLRRIVIY
jgi:hypothetical protein